MSTRITYLLGAGASAEVLPLVENMGDRMRDMRTRINDLISEVEKKEYFLEELDSFIDEMKNHGSIDICMRRMFLQGKDNRADNQKYLKYKRLLAAYLTLEQMEMPDKPGLDKRYDSFFANFLNAKTDKFPADFRILTWNYDYQFICAGEKYLTKSYNALKNILSISASGAINKNDGAKIICLNGIIEKSRLSPTVVQENFTAPKCNLSLNRDSILKVIDSYNEWTSYCINNGIISTPLTFSWDSDNTIRDFAKNETLGTEILIIVGYSFPFFNRVIDKEILSGMKGLKNIFIQGKNMEDSKRLKNKFVKVFNWFVDSRNPPDIEEVEGDKKEFFVPPSIDFEI